MNAANLAVMYGHLEGAGGDFARDPTGHLSIEAGIFEKHGLKVSWNHVQGTEERYRRLENGSAQISLVVGRASLQHFLASKTTRILGVAMNRCPYYLIAHPSIRSFADLKDKVVACREGPAPLSPRRCCRRGRGSPCARRAAPAGRPIASRRRGFPGECS